MENADSRAAPRAIVLTFDHLHPGFLGCYGNDWIETPNLDRLATESVVFDWHFCENLDVAAANHAWWTGQYQFPLAEEQQHASRTFLERLEAAGVRSRLIVEADDREESRVAPRFGEVSIVRGIDGFEINEKDTPFARVVAACEQLFKESSASTSGPSLLWIKSRGIPAPWVPPRDFADLYLAEFGLADAPDDSDSTVPGEDQDDKPEESSTAPETSTGDDSLDWRYGAAMYAAYVTLVDRWVGKLLGAIAGAPGWNEALLIVTVGAGHVLGEHGRLDDASVHLRGECLQTPLWLRLHGCDQAGTRRQALIRTTDLAPTLLAWFAVPVENRQAAAGPTGCDLLPLVRNEADTCREFALMGIGRQEWGIRSPEFFYVEPGDSVPEDGRSSAQLFEKPRDRWDQSDVCAQYPAATEELRAKLLEAIRRISADRGSSFEKASSS